MVFKEHSYCTHFMIKPHLPHEQFLPAECQKQCLTLLLWQSYVALSVQALQPTQILTLRDISSSNGAHVQNVQNVLSR